MDSGSRKPRPKSEETEQNCHPLRVNQVRLQRRRFVETHVGMGINLLSKRNSSSGPATLRVLCPQGCTACGSCARLCDGWPRVSPPGACGHSDGRLSRVSGSVWEASSHPCVDGAGGCASLPFCPCPASVLGSQVPGLAFRLGSAQQRPTQAPGCTISCAGRQLPEGSSSSLT